jgi:hypothetical protein
MGSDAVGDVAEFVIDRGGVADDAHLRAVERRRCQQTFRI